MRSLNSPSGRLWTASLFYIPAAFANSDLRDGGAACPAVLRFHSQDLVLDLLDWPDDWMLLPETELLSLILRAQLAVFRTAAVRRAADGRPVRGATFAAAEHASDFARPHSVRRALNG